MTSETLPPWDAADMPAVFTRFADGPFAKGYAPLYERLSRAIAADPWLCELAAAVRPGQLPPNLLLSSVRRLLMDEPNHPLAAFHEDIGTATAPENSDPVPLFTDFCHTHEAALRAMVATRLVQTNEARRGSVLLPAITYAARRVASPIALIDAGCSAGFNLCLDRFGYTYSDGLAAGDAAAALQFACEIRGTQHPPLPPPPPDVVQRIGVDLHPLPANDPETSLWLRSLVWPGQIERVHRVAAALEIAAHADLRLIQGDMIDILPRVIAGVPAGVTPLVMTTFVLIHLSEGQRKAFETMLRTASSQRTVLWITTDRILGLPEQTLELNVMRDGESTRSVLAHHHPHGEWLEWVAP